MTPILRTPNSQDFTRGGTSNMEAIASTATEGKLRILHVIGSMDPDAGGPPNIVSRLAAAQAGLGHDVAVMSYGDESVQARALRDAARVPNGEKVRHIWLKPAGRLDKLFGRQAYKLFARLLPEFDVVHTQGVWEPIILQAARVARRLGVVHVIAPQGMLDPWSLGQKRLKKTIALRLGYHHMLSNASALLLLNEDEKTLIQPLGFKSPQQILANGMSPAEIYPLEEPGTFRAAHPEIGAHPYVLFLSRLHFKKGLDILAEAYHRFVQRRPDVHLVVAGPDEGQRQNFIDAIDRMNLNDRVHLVGPLYGRDKKAALRDAACFCLPSRQEGFSIAIIEAMACELPVVITEGCHFPEVAEFNAGRVTPLDPAAVAQALEDVVANETVRIAMGQAGRKLIESRFTWQRIAEQSIEIYRGLIAKTNRR
ncbi:MAG TPA: glycosyltransferase [Tepidisphaeraceae bacterium]